MIQQQSSCCFKLQIIRILIMADCCGKRVHQPRKKKEGPYVKVNAYTQPFSCEQILTFIIFLIQLVMHSIFIVPALPAISNTILWILLGFHYAMLLIIGYDYIDLTSSDPVDRLILYEEMISKYHIQDMKMCLLCNTQVHKNSHHCLRCDRCVQQFDHHCKFLNNCIGSRNYEAFFRILLAYTFYNINIIGMGIWVLIINFPDKTIAFEGNQWGVLSLVILTFFISLLVLALMVFHCYISCYENTTTFTHNYPLDERKSDDVIQNMNINLWEAPTSGERIRNEAGKNIF